MLMLFSYQALINEARKSPHSAATAAPPMSKGPDYGRHNTISKNCEGKGALLIGNSLPPLGGARDLIS